MEMRRRKYTTIIDDIALSKLKVDSSSDDQNIKPHEWIRVLRNNLRMTQAELANRANITKANLVAIESGKVDPRVSTLHRIYKALSCHLSFEPQPLKPLEEVLRGRARAIALERLKKTMGTMALEEQAPDEEMFRKLLEKRTNEILHNPREKLWRNADDR